MCAVLGDIWREGKGDLTDMRANRRSDQLMHADVYQSSGWATRYNCYKVSLHIVFPELHVSAEQSTIIRHAILKFIAEKPK